ncbi:hypothetical protein M23134_02292 [Microscilla marina ATCC 23134]|uniref:Uncharacterized protein n=1 Tax=Microscilla marina ATCC 23134 TaxID=313606 RepID=A1ZK75_MICM2|nr:hypothetical protein M23134_02292 [Microscilla marina ATCC 23134]
MCQIFFNHNFYVRNKLLAFDKIFHSYTKLKDEIKNVNLFWNTPW